MGNPTTIVNSWNEWDPLKRVILGRADGGMIETAEPAIQRDWSALGVPFGSHRRFSEEMIGKANEQLDYFARTLESRGVQVDRPDPIDASQQVSTPDWVQDTMVGCMPPRDLLMAVGNEILEATMSLRSRWFEYLNYRPIIQRYYRDDPNFRHEAAPKPRLNEQTYKPKFYEHWETLTSAEKDAAIHAADWILTETEPCFDAADCVRFGRDMFVQKSMVTNEMGIRWLRQHFPELRVHRVFYNETQPWHIDTTLVPLRPGLVMINPVRTPLESRQLELFEKNGWQVIMGPKALLTKKRPFAYTSLWLNINVFVIDPKTVCVEASETPVQELLDRLGFNVLPIPFYDVSPFGGGLHCSTCDVHREGSLEDYLPMQIEGY